MFRRIRRAYRRPPRGRRRCASATPYLRPLRGLAGRYREELTMSDIMRPIPFSQLMNWIIEEHKTQDAIFGVRKMVTTNQEGALPIF